MRTGRSLAPLAKECRPSDSVIALWANQATHPVRVMGRLLQFSKSGY